MQSESEIRSSLFGESEQDIRSSLSGKSKHEIPAEVLTQIGKIDGNDGYPDKTEDSKNMDILKYYRDGKIVKEDDLDKVEELASIGLIRMGMNFRKSQETAKTTKLGLRFI